MSAIVPFDFSSPAPAARQRRRETSINADAIIHSAGYPSISIKGKVFAVVQGDQRQPLMREIDGDMIPVAALRLAVVRANAKYRVFYAKQYVEGDSDGAKPTCFSHDGQRPDVSVETPQAANCQLCPHAQWGSKVTTDGTAGKGTACTVNTRVAVVNPRQAELQPMLLRIPAGSRANFSAAVSQADQHGKDYNEVVFKIGFDPEAPSPKLTFTPEGLLADEIYERVSALYDDPTVRDIVGVPSVPAAQLAAPPAYQQLEAPAPVAAPPAPAPAPVAAPAPKPAVKAALSVDDLDDVPVTPPKQRAARPPKAAEPAPAPAPVAAAPASAATAEAQNLLAGLGNLLDMSDD